MTIEAISEGEAITDCDSLYFDDQDGLLKAAQNSHKVGVSYFSWLWNLLSIPRSYINEFLRDRIRDRTYFPLTYPDKAFQNDIDCCAELREMLLGNIEPPKTQLFPAMAEIRDAFDIRPISINIESEGKIYTFNLYEIQSKGQINGKGLRLFLFSFYGNSITENGVEREWKPDTIDELSVAPILLLKALYANGYPMDSLDLFSLGASTLGGLKFLDNNHMDIIPKTIILDRGMSSTYKVIQKLFSFPFRHLAYAAAYLSNWTIDPEQACLEYFSTAPSLEGRTLIHIEAVKDLYFSGEGAYDDTFCTRLEELGMKTYNGRFYVPCYEEGSHHSLARQFLYNNPNSGSDINSFFPMNPYETLAEALIREIFSDPNYTSGSFHQGLVVGGNGENRDITLMRCYCLLEAFLNMQKEEAALADSNAAATA